MEPPTYLSSAQVSSTRVFRVLEFRVREFRVLEYSNPSTSLHQTTPNHLQTALGELDSILGELPPIEGSAVIMSVDAHKEATAANT